MAAARDVGITVSAWRERKPVSENGEKRSISGAKIMKIWFGQEMMTAAYWRKS
jgi:hypothetical protein